MARNLYSAYRAVGTSSGQYKASLFDVESSRDKMGFAEKRGAWEEEKLSRRVETIGSVLELASTVAGSMETQSEFKSDILPELQEKKFLKDFMPEDYGLKEGTTFEQFKKSQPVTFGGAMEAYKPMQVDQSIWQKLAGKEKMYTFGEGGKEYKQSDLTALGQESVFSSIQEDFGISMGDETGMSSDNLNEFKDLLTKSNYGKTDIAEDETPDVGGGVDPIQLLQQDQSAFIGPPEETDLQRRRRFLGLD
jgi:hypothetical protein